MNSLKGMYKDYFLDYASYVILERAVPSIEDGLKPVQRRILHAMKEMDDGRFHKVANIIGQTMQFHPHGDAAIGDALVNLGQKELLIDTQGNWGDTRTGDSAAAPRYIEARLSKFALEVSFNKKITDWSLSYDGRKEEPVNLPMKFPLLLAMGVEGIAVGLSTKILPHNFIELLKGSIKILQEKKVTLYPDFLTGGRVDVSEYNHGKRGGRVKVRARIERKSNSELVITELPYGVTTSSMIDSILKANDKGKIKIKRVSDNTAKNVEIVVELAGGVSPELAEDALYAFTNCEVSISPNACVIVDEKPVFMSVLDILKLSTEHTKNLLRKELEINLAEQREKWHFASLEKIFINERVYRRIEECESWEEVLESVEEGMLQYIATPSHPAEKGEEKLLLQRDLSEEDIDRLTGIKIKRISKYNIFKADERIKAIEEEIAILMHHLDNLVEYAIDYFQSLIDKYGKGKERRTEIETFDEVKRAEVIINNAKLYVKEKDGFIGMDLKTGEFLKDCSDLADVITFRKDGKYSVVRIEDKVYVGKNIIHTDIWKQGDERTTYNTIYTDGKSGRTYAKRFHVAAITRATDYDLTTGEPNSKLHYFSANPNGEAEIVEVQLSPESRARIKKIQYDFSELDIKGRRAKGNTVTKYPVRRVKLIETGKSTLSAIDLYMDEVTGRLNKDERGLHIGAFNTGDNILAIYDDGSYDMHEITFELNKKYKPDEIVFIGKYDENMIVSALYYDGERKWTILKRFEIETSTTNQRFVFITEDSKSELIHASVAPHPIFKCSYRDKNGSHIEKIDVVEFIDVKGWRAIGNKVSDYKFYFKEELQKVVEKETTQGEQETETDSEKGENTDKKNKDQSKAGSDDNKVNIGDTINFDVDEDDAGSEDDGKEEQGSLF